MVLAALAATAAAAGCGAGATSPQQSNLAPTPSPMSASQVRQSVREQCEQSREQPRKAHPDAVVSDCNYGEGTLTIGRADPPPPPSATQPPPPLTQQVHDALLAALRADPGREPGTSSLQRRWRVHRADRRRGGRLQMPDHPTRTQRRSFGHRRRAGRWRPGDPATPSADDATRAPHPAQTGVWGVGLRLR